MIERIGPILTCLLFMGIALLVNPGAVPFILGLGLLAVVWGLLLNLVLGSPNGPSGGSRQ